MSQWTRDELRQIRGAYLGAHREAKTKSIPREERNALAKAAADEVKLRLRPPVVQKPKTKRGKGDETK